MEYVSQVLLEVDGQSITDFTKVEEGEYELNKAVKLMNKTGSMKTQPRYTVTLDYVVPFDVPEFDFTTVSGGKIVIDYQNGTRVSYSGVAVLKIGKLTHDGDKEAVKTIEFTASDRK